MDGIRIEEYQNPDCVGFLGWIEPDDKSWILFVRNDGQPLFFGKRNPTGAVIVNN